MAAAVVGWGHVLANTTLPATAAFSLQVAMNLKKGYSSLDVGLVEQFSIIERLQESYSVQRLCEVFDVHRSSYRAWRDRPADPNPEELQLQALVKAAHKTSNGSAGARSIAKMVTQSGTPLSRYRARRRMKLLGLESTQVPAHAYKKAEQPHIDIPNLLDREFGVGQQNTVWSGDITYVWSGTRWAYLAVVLEQPSNCSSGLSITARPSSGRCWRGAAFPSVSWLTQLPQTAQVTLQ
jgi:putative transposase